MQILEQLRSLNLQNCRLEKIGSWLWISGATYSIKEQLKSLGFLFSSSKKAWFYNGSSLKSRMSFYKTIEELKNKWGVENVLL